MGTTLDNGIYLPDEGERNCYEGLAGNWVALDNHIGSTHIHVTINDKQAWNSHVADTTIHVTSADKQAWNGHVADSVKHVTAEDKAKWDAVTSKANDSEVVHKSGNETISGNKTFSENVLIYNSDASVDTKYLIFKNQKVKRGSTTETGTQFITFQDKDSGILVSYETNVSSSGNTQAYINVSNLDTNSQRVTGGVKVIKTPTETWFIPDGNNTVSSGLSNYKWKDVQTKLINGLEPSSLSLPSGNVNDFIDISSYFSNTGSGDTSTYTALANGWIYLRLGNISSCQVVLNDSSNRRLWGTSATGNVEQIIMPILKNTTLTTTWVTNSTVNVATARFIPCQGNV